MGYAQGPSAGSGSSCPLHMRWSGQLTHAVAQAQNAAVVGARCQLQAAGDIHRPCLYAPDACNQHKAQQVGPQLGCARMLTHAAPLRATSAWCALQARDEASMKPSVARKLNEKIRGLEAELEELRSNKKVKELEKKVQVSSWFQDRKRIWITRWHVEHDRGIQCFLPLPVCLDAFAATTICGAWVDMNMC